MNLAPDLDEARRFLSILDPSASSFTFQTFDDSESKDPRLLRTLNGSLDQHADELARLNDAGAGIFVTINETDLTGRKTDNVRRVRALFVDLDGAPIEPVESYTLPPHAVIASSPGKWHAYWRVEGVELGEFRSMQEALIQRFGADPSVKDLPRVMRLPGFYHCKAKPFLTKIQRVRELAPYGAGDFRVAVPVTEGAQHVVAEGDTSASIVAIVDKQCQRLSELSAGSKKRNNTLNTIAYIVGGLVGAGLVREDYVRGKLVDAADACGLPRIEANKTIDSGLAAGIKAPWSPNLMLDPSNPIRSARKMIDDRFRDSEGNVLLVRHRETFWQWDGSRYVIVEREPMAAAVWSYTEHARTMGGEGPSPFKPNPDRVNAIVQALRATTQIKEVDAPTWLRGADDNPPPSEFMAVKNGLLHLPQGELWRPTPHYFNTVASDVRYDPDAPAPQRWTAFLDETFGDDTEAREALQDFVGYLLTPNTSLQKILLMVGPPRSGKGTVARVIRELVGHDSVAGPTMHSLSGEFGLEPLIPRTVAIISDARIGARTDKAAVTERLLSISGEDALTVNRKNTSQWTGRLQTRFAILTNELPALSDGSGALANRFVIIMLTNSMLGREDPTLFDKLKAEMPSILNWAIDGYERLRSRGHFVQPASGQEALDEIQTLAAPKKAFVRDMCDVGPGLEVASEVLWEQWKDWCTSSSANFGSKNWFFRDLKTAVPGIKEVERGTDRTPFYVGITIKDVTSIEAERARKDAENPPPF